MTQPVAPTSRFAVLTAAALLCLTILAACLLRTGAVRAFLHTNWLQLGIEIEANPPVSGAAPNR